MSEAMWNFRAALSTAVGLLLGFVVAADAASAMHCHDWMRLDPARKQAAVQRMIDEALQSHRARQYNINRAAVGRCLTAHAAQMALEFDDVCSDSRTADLQAIQRVFKTYSWSCAG